ncbi:hypothetical protein RhiirA1_459608 [Rhizophagus irregularis]|uniref:Uncharacterized protein n=1 Tax=Rhizophagus irregularis TaxID=588596 RepID=A0A2N0RT83_9GLOM|nr:hypothetical protein RhiirA1_459608 [Rhizophagus irregularis]
MELVFIYINEEVCAIDQEGTSMAKQCEIMHEYTTLNDDFTKRLKDENCKQDEREVGEKRPMLESPSPRKPKESEEKKKTRRQEEEFGNWHLII